MPAKGLIRVDLRIALLRELTAQGNATAATHTEMTELLKKRSELIQKLIDERSGEGTPRAEY